VFSRTAQTGPHGGRCVRRSTPCAANAVRFGALE